MTPKFSTKDVAKSAYANFLKRAEECWHAAEHAHKNREWNAAAINAIHCSIAACDAMCTYYLGQRHTGENHDDAAALFRTIKAGDEINLNANRIVRILRFKNMAEYEERLIRQSETEKIFLECERLWVFVIKELPKTI